MNRILLIDLSQREREARSRLGSERDALRNMRDNTNSNDRRWDQADAERLAELEEVLDNDNPVDRLYQTVASVVADQSWDSMSDNPKDRKWTLEHGLFLSQRGAGEEAATRFLTDTEQEVAAICGLLQLDGVDLDGAGNRRHAFHSSNGASGSVVRRISEAQGEYRESQALFDAAFSLFSRKFEVGLNSQIQKGLVDREIEGCVAPGGSIDRRKDAKGILPSLKDRVHVLSARNIANVVRRLHGDGMSAGDPWLSSRLENAYNMLTGVTEGRSPSALEIVPPNLDEAVDVEIQKGNLDAMQGLYFAHMIEETRMFQVVERIVELFRAGLVPVSRGKAGDFLFSYFRKAAERITEGERRDLYQRLFGAPGGPSFKDEPNREFNELWLRFMSSVSSFARQSTVERLLRGSVPLSVSQEQVRKAARDLGANLSRNGYGIAYFAATELQQTIIEFRDLLQDPELRSAFGARDMWQVIDMVNVNYLGGARNTHRYRTQAKAGAVVIRWIANNASRLTNISGDVISVEQLANPQLRAANGADHNPMVEPTDWDLVNACEQWLAVGGVQDQSVEQYSQPIESPVMTSRPIDIPQAAREAMDSVGVSLPGM